MVEVPEEVVEAVVVSHVVDMVVEVMGGSGGSTSIYSGNGATASVFLTGATTT